MTMSRSVKTERRTPSSTAASGAVSNEDRALDEWARSLVSRPTPNIGTQTQQGPQGTLNSFLIQNPSNPSVGPDGLPLHSGYDVDSAIGRFTWQTVGTAEDKYVPCLFRCGIKYCSVRMAEISLLGDLLRQIPVELFECIKIPTYQVTPLEARVLGHINAWHCDGFFGAEQFSTKDQIVTMSDAERFYEYLHFAYSVLTSGGRNNEKDYSSCAFIKVNSDNLIPYTVLSTGEKGVPLFYFEGQTDILKQKAEPLTGWELAYLKVCCKVQGVRKDLIAGTTLQIVKVSDLRSYFPKRTIFTEDCWPEPKSKNLLFHKGSNGIAQNYSSNALPKSDTWTVLATYKSTSTVSATNTSVTSNTTTASSRTSNSRSNSMSSRPVSISAASGTRSGSATTTASTTSTSNTQQTPTVISVKVSVGNNNNNTPPRYVTNGSYTPPPDLLQKAEALKRLKVMNHPLDSTRLQQIPDFSDPLNRESAYTIKLIIIDHKPFLCINMTQFQHGDGHMIILQQFMETFFPSVSIYPTAVGVLKNCGVVTYLPNKAQIKTLNTYGITSVTRNWEIPLVLALGVTQNMTKLKNFFGPRSAATAVNNSSKTNGYPPNSSTLIRR